MYKLPVETGFKTYRPQSGVRLPKEPLRIQVQQGAGQVLCNSAQAWDRLRFMDPQGNMIAESHEAREWRFEIGALPSGPYWVVAECGGQRSSRAFVL